MSSTVTTKGQVTIPKAVRDYLGIVPGTEIDFQMAPDGRIVLAKVDGKKKVSRFERLRGHAGIGLSTDEIMALTRGEN